MSLFFALTLLFIRQTCTGTDQKCQSQECAPGYFKKGDCGPKDNLNLCEKCPEGFFTAIPNIIPQCHECNTCNRGMVAKKNCTTVSDIECVCKEGHYRRQDRCWPCWHDGSSDFKHCTNAECQSYPPCTLLLTGTGTTKAPTLTTASATPQRKNTTSTNTTSTNTTSTTPTVHPPAELNFSLWVILVILMLPALYCFPVFFVRTLYKYLHLCPRWRIKQDMEAPAQVFKDPGCHQSRGPTTLKFTFSEETPMMNVMSPAPSERPLSPLLPNEEPTVAREPSELWPAIVLYTVIKEVPLRRWKEFLRLLSVADRELERVELDAGLSSMERQYQMLRLWSQRSSASVDDIFSVLHHMELSGCAQMLKESLEKLQWRQRVTA